MARERERVRRDNCQIPWSGFPFTRRKRRNESRKRKPLQGLDERLQGVEECKKIKEGFTARCSSRDTATWERRTVPEKGYAVAVMVMGFKNAQGVEKAEEDGREVQSGVPQARRWTLSRRGRGIVQDDTRGRPSGKRGVGSASWWSSPMSTSSQQAGPRQCRVFTSQRATGDRPSPQGPATRSQAI